MKKSIYYTTRWLPALCISAIFWGFTMPKQASHPSKEAPKTLVQSSMSGVNLISNDGQVDANLLAFLDLYGLRHNGTVKSVNKAMQENFLRGPGRERRDLKASQLDEKVKDQALALLSQMGLVEEIPCSAVTVDYFLLFGAMIGGIERRYSDFVKQYTQGTLQCRNVVLLGGVRKPRPHEIEQMEQELGKKDFAAFLDQVGKPAKEALTETDLFRFVWATRATAQMKEEFQEGKNLFFINDTNTTDGNNHRPTTKTTLEVWYETCQPEPGRCHTNVEQPYGARMVKVLQLFLEKKSQALQGTDKHFSITYNSPRASEHLSLPIYKDELARTFYQECILKGY